MACPSKPPDIDSLYDRFIRQDEMKIGGKRSVTDAFALTAKYLQTRNHAESGCWCPCA